MLPDCSLIEGIIIILSKQFGNELAQDQLSNIERCGSNNLPRKSSLFLIEIQPEYLILSVIFE